MIVVFNSYRFFFFLSQGGIIYKRGVGYRKPCAHLHDKMTSVHLDLQEEQLSITKMKPEGASINHEDLNSMRYGLKVRVYTLKVMHLALNWKHLRQMFSNVKNQSVFYPGI